MTSPGSACVCVGDPGLRAVVLAVLARRGYEVRIVEGANLIDALRSGELTVVALGAGQVNVAAILEYCDRWSAGLSRPLIALVNRRERHVASAALAAGITNIALAPIEAADLDLEVALAERRSAERERFFATLRAIPDRVAIYDGGGQLLFANRGGRAKPVDELLAGNRIGDLPSGVRETVTPAFERARTGQLDLVEIEKHGIHGRVRLIPFGNGPDRGVALVASDITRQRRMEEELRASVVKADALLDVLPDMMFRVRDDGVVVDFQPAWAEKLAAPIERIVGRSVADVLPPQSPRQTLEALALVLETGNSQRFEFPLATPNGEHEYEARLSSAGSTDVVAIVRDITEAKRLQAQLALANRLAALGTLAAGVAHEVNNPLTYVLIGIEAVVQGAAPQVGRRADRRPPAAHARAPAGRHRGVAPGATHRVGASLAGARQRAGSAAGQRLRCCSTRRRRWWRASSAAAPASCASTARACPPSMGRQDRLGQVFLNLLLNAAQSVQERSAPDSAVTSAPISTPPVASWSRSRTPAPASRAPS